jgi:hypothetical protein
MTQSAQGEGALTNARIVTIVPPRRISWQKQLLFACIICVGILALIEAGVRVGAYVLFGRSPFFLFYGLTSWSGDDNPEGHTAVHNGYFKFEPSRTLHQYGMFTAADGDPHQRGRLSRPRL